MKHCLILSRAVSHSASMPRKPNLRTPAKPTTQPPAPAAAPKPETKPAPAAPAKVETKPSAAPATPQAKPETKPAATPAKPATPTPAPTAAKPTPPAPIPATAKPATPPAKPVAPAPKPATPVPAVAAKPPPPKPVAIFPDKALEAAVRKQVFAKRDNQEVLTAEDVATVSIIEGKKAGIKDLTGLEKCIALASLTLPENQITNLAPIKGLERPAIPRCVAQSNQRSHATGCLQGAAIH
jgi:internalin A